MSSLDSKFGRVLKDYKDACPDMDGSPGFASGIWGRIEAHKKFLRNARGWTSAYVTFAAVLCLLLVVLIAFQAGVMRSTYVDVLDANQESSELIEAGTAAAKEK